MGRRDKDAPAAVPKAMKDLVNETLQKYKVPEQVVPRKVATPVRSGSVPPVVTTPEAKAAGTPNPPASTPIPEPNCKKSKLEYRDRKDSFMSLKSLPKLPSFSSSTSNGPRHLDSQSTIDINLDALDLNRGPELIPAFSIRFQCSWVPRPPLDDLHAETLALNPETLNKEGPGVSCS